MGNKYPVLRKCLGTLSAHSSPSYIRQRQENTNLVIPYELSSLK